MSKEKILKFMKAKDAAVREATCLPLYDEEDFTDFETVETADSVFMELRDHIQIAGTMFLQDSLICPHCIVYDCSDCPYGRRHGICGSHYDDRYSRLLDRVDAIGYIPGVQEACLDLLDDED